MARLALIAVTVIILSNLVAALLVAGYQIYYDGMIFPGVSVWGTDLGGMTPDEAAQALNGRFDYPQSSLITFRDNSDIWPVTAGELGVQFDVARTVQAAYEVGRHPNLLPGLRQQLAAWRQGVVVSPVIVYDQRAADVYMNQITAMINRPAVDATIRIDGTRAIATSGQIGRMVDREATMTDLQGLITSLESGEVDITVQETPPAILSADQAAAEINVMLGSELQLYIEDATVDDPGPWVASPDALASMLVIDRVPDDEEEGMAHYEARLDEGQLAAFLEPLAPELSREPANARFDFHEETGELVPIVASVEGRELNVPSTIQLVNQLILTDDHSVPLVFDMLEPAVPDTATAQQLGITELISSASTYFAGSSAERRINVDVAASRFDGLIIAPGQEFSFNEYLGDVSTEEGFEQALIIYNGRTIEGVGGGVCQVSTTAFQAIFYAGFPINERWPHGYWVGYYDSGEGKGMDATVYSPLVDLRFTNDLSSYLLIETETNLNTQTVTFRFYSTGDGRTVQKDGPYVSNVVPHGPPLYETNSALSAGQVKQVDYAVDGFDSTVYRTVYRNGELLYQDTFFSQYMPWRAIYQVPPGDSRANG